MINFCQRNTYHHDTYQNLESKAKSCQSCVLSKHRSQVVFGHGPLNADIMLIGEGPGQQEDEVGKPFVGRSGKVLRALILEAGIDCEQEVYISNTVKCRPPENRTPSKLEVAACQGYLIRQIQCIQPKILLLCGAAAMRSVLETKVGITKMRGQWLEAKVAYMQMPLKIMTIFHPSYLLRNPSQAEGKPKWQTLQDIKQVKQGLELDL
eukprot:COSAG01_NODE_1_length_100484_cov_170.446142_25_plen_208_part_00